jgi:hypothetical protein
MTFADEEIAYMRSHPLARLIAGYVAFSHTEMCVRLPRSKASRCHPPHRFRSRIPARRAMRSSSDGQTYRCGEEKVRSSPSITHQCRDTSI